MQLAGGGMPYHRLAFLNSIFGDGMTSNYALDSMDSYVLTIFSCIIA